jgi:hypothetical protein
VAVPSEFALSQNYPNPFNPTTTFTYQLPESAHVLVKVFNSLGEEMLVLVNKLQQAGNYSLVWDASNYASGLYFYSIEADDFKHVKKMLFIR